MIGERARRAIAGLFGGIQAGSGTAGQPSTSPGERVYVIGDVHGEMGLLQKLLVAIEQDDVARKAVTKKRLIFLGDLIDRGAGSAQVVSLLVEAQRVSSELVVLMGNHEAAFLESIDGNAAAQRLWLEHGGSATLHSYGIETLREEESPEQFARRLRASIPHEIIDWLGELPMTARSGDYFFCHAGVRPGTALNRQKPQDLLWIRHEFLDDQRDHGAVIVHGHSICGPEVEFHPNRINVDTGAYSTGILSALGLEDEERWVISVRAGEVPSHRRKARLVTET
jgi:serine/threonine protein phosphatase 1